MLLLLTQLLGIQALKALDVVRRKTRVKLYIEDRQAAGMYGCITLLSSDIAMSLSLSLLLQHGVPPSNESEGTFGVGTREEPHRFYSPQHSQATLLCTGSPGPAAYK